MKIYTKTGDTGLTGLIGGLRVSKADPRIDCYGTVDELNAAIGLAGVGATEPIASALARIQNELFVIGSHLAVVAGTRHAEALPVLDNYAITRLESEIDAAEAQLPPLQQFILPAGSETTCRLHLARTICRRAERLLVSSLTERPLPPMVLSYINRLSDWLFVHARLANQLAGIPDVPWQK